MPGAAWLVLACLWGSSPQSGPEPPAAPSSPAELAVPPPADAPSPAAPSPAAPSPSEPSATADPWAAVPVQMAAPKQPVAPTATDGPLLDPWAAGRRNASRSLDPELRNPFRGMRPRHDAPRLAHADLRDPFARSSGSPAGRAMTRPQPAPTASEPTASEPTASEPTAASEPVMPLHPDLRDPFGRRKARPTPPSESAPAPAPRSTAPSAATAAP